MRHLGSIWGEPKKFDIFLLPVVIVWITNSFFAKTNKRATSGLLDARLTPLVHILQSQPLRKCYAAFGFQDVRHEKTTLPDIYFEKLWPYLFHGVTAGQLIW